MGTGQKQLPVERKVFLILESTEKIVELAENW